MYSHFLFRLSVPPPPETALFLITSDLPVLPSLGFSSSAGGRVLSCLLFFRLIYRTLLAGVLHETTDPTRLSSYGEIQLASKWVSARSLGIYVKGRQGFQRKFKQSSAGFSTTRPLHYGTGSDPECLRHTRSRGMFFVDFSSSLLLTGAVLRCACLGCRRFPEYNRKIVFNPIDPSTLTISPFRKLQPVSCFTGQNIFTKD